MRPVFRWIPERLEKVTTLDALSRPIQKTIGRLVPQGTPLKDLLSGTWLGHPLHPMLTDVVIGAWTSAWFLDLLPTKRTDDASDALVGVGILAALPTAAAGLSDWSELGDGERRVGAFHALGNVTALSLYVLSYANRRRGHRRSGWILAMLGSGAATFSGLLGGHLSFARGVGVNQTAFDRAPARWTPVMQESDLRPGRLTGANAGSVAVVLYRNDGEIYALTDRCSHRGCPLRSGVVDEDLNVVCSCHGSTFHLVDGRIVRGPATAHQPSFEVRVADGTVEVRRRD
jgi:nitrite reductase/ring-hydroxylating ferredoxin subunit/uncharacterized membrane protein